MEWILIGVNVGFAVIGWLLADKNHKQEKEIAEMKIEHRKNTDNLYALVHANETKLAKHRLAIAQNHYTQPQVDSKFHHLDSAIRELSADIKELTKALTDHMVHGDK